MATATRPALETDELAILNVQRTCVHDGPGVRTTVFFRGCPLKCRWCHNPEAQAFTGAGCAGTVAAAEVLEQVDRDEPYYAITGGGVTLSGGEPLARDRGTLVRFLDRLRGRNRSITVETAGDVPWRTFEAVLPLVDLFLFDLKVVGDPMLHALLTGRDGRRIRRNAERLVASGADVRFRMCVVPDHNDTHENLAALADFLHALGRPEIELMRYYDLHEEKNLRFALDRAPLGISAERSARALQHALDVLRARGIDAHTVGTEPAVQPSAHTDRVLRIRQDIRDAGYAVCLESARLKTAFYKHRTVGEPVAEERAELLGWLLSNKRIEVHPGELLVGNFTSKRVGGSVWVEYFGLAMVLNLWRIDRQEPTAFACSAAEKREFYGRIAPFWADRGLLQRAFPGGRALLGTLVRTVEKRHGFNNNLAGVAHFVANCGRILELGTTGLIAEARAGRVRDPANPFWIAAIRSLEALEGFADRYAHRLEGMAVWERDSTRRAELKEMARVCRTVPRQPAQTLHEALQAILFLHIGLCTESFENAISLGRLDQVLQPYFEADLRAGRIDRARARELVACFILKIDEVVFLNDGDTMFQIGKLFESLSPVETVTVGGTHPDGSDATNDLTWLILDACELRPLGVNMAARIHGGSPPEYVERIAGIYLGGSPMPALFNDGAYVPALRNEYGVTAGEARDYAIVGCVEPVACADHFANTDSANINLVTPFLQALKGEEDRLWRLGELPYADKRLRRAVRRHLPRPKGLAAELRRARKRLERRYRSGPWNPPTTMAQLLDRYALRLTELVRDVLADQQRIEGALAEHLPTALASSLYAGCMERGLDVHRGGTRLNSSGIQAVGVTDVADSLAALDQLVFQEQRYTLQEVLGAMEDDFEGPWQQEIRDALLAVPKFGDDASAHAHEWMHRVLQIYTEALRQADHSHRNGRYVAGYYGLNVNRIYGKKTPALPSGRRYGEPLANSLCPHFGMQQTDLSSALNAVAKLDFARYAPNGASLTSTIDTGMFAGEGGVKNLAGLIRGFFDQGGMQFQPNLVSREKLLDAYRNPGKHKDLMVRIAGYCAYFDDLSDELKREIIDRSYYA